MGRRPPTHCISHTTRPSSGIRLETRRNIGVGGGRSSRSRQRRTSETRLPSSRRISLRLRCTGSSSSRQLWRRAAPS